MTLTNPSLSASTDVNAAAPDPDAFPPSKRPGRPGSSQTLTNIQVDTSCAKTLPVSKDGRSYWAYSWCAGKYVNQYHVNPLTRKTEHENRIDVYIQPTGRAAEKNVQHFKSVKEDCQVLSTGKFQKISIYYNIIF